MIKKILNLILLLFGFIALANSSGWHTADEILAGNFSYNYNFTGIVDFSSATVLGLNVTSSSSNTNESMISDWPDAIVCNVTNPSWGGGYAVFHLALNNYISNGLTYYSFAQQGATNYDIRYNSDGTFNSYSSLTTTNCGVSISTLKAEGRAFNFVGGSGVTTSGSSGVPAGTIGAFYLSSCPPGWAAADGTSGTPDLRGQFLRGLNDFGSTAGVRNDGKEDPDGLNRILGSWQNDTFRSHNHGIGQYGLAASGGVTYGVHPAYSVGIYTEYSGQNETRPKNVGVIYCVSTGAGSSAIGDNLSAFSVNKGGVAQTVSTATPTLITWNTKVFDSNNEFNLTTGRFEPKVAGKYLITAGLYIGAINDGKVLYVRLHKNGALYAMGTMVPGGGFENHLSTISIIVDAVPGDYFEVWGSHNHASSADILADSYRTYFTGARLDSDSYWSYNNTDLSYVSGNVGIGTTSPSAKLEVNGSIKITCPTGFTSIEGNGKQLGCMQTAEAGSTTWWTAGNNCLINYGGRLPTLHEWYAATNNYALTDETDDYEWSGDIQAGSFAWAIGSSSLTTINNFAFTDSLAYRCFIIK